MQRLPVRTSGSRATAILRSRRNALLLAIAAVATPSFFGFKWTSLSSRRQAMIFNLPKELPDSLLKRLDCIVVLGGGVPLSLEEPPVFTQRRCDDAADLVARRRKLQPSKETLPILCLSAGTAHLPQSLFSPDGLPVWESTASAAYLQKKHNMIDNVYLETTSYDTIGNAFFARTIHTDIVGWKNLLIVTNEFHMERTKAIFDWIYSIPGSYDYELNYLASENIGVPPEGLEARRPHEQKGTRTVKDKLAPQYKTMAEVHTFLTTDHDFYSAAGLVKRAKAKSGTQVDSALKESYSHAGVAKSPEAKNRA